ncbi:toxin-antitoxin system YwqK family antitoxin [Fusobacterium pseudoperiodonticum]|uniref:Cytoplasmic protein n=1 Tax=Fusobacterium pseudoperiodonticum TaxID=2663009 RepID=A0A2G9EJN0_9FUSO|nr:cytoplasmic protein [Fusobacterium pseudoperiodonticum]PIM80861.1 cytoplasmic protein [Fusobacterium pseudoperiodonticum]
MKKVLLGFLVVIMTLFVACEAKTDYEYKDGVMYENKKPATGTFEFKSGDYKVKSQFVDGVPEGVLEKYYLDGKLMIKDVFEGGEIIQEEIYYKNGNLMGFSDAEGLKMYYDDGQLLMSSTYSTGETILYHENGNPMMEVLNDDVAIYNEDNERLFKAEGGAMVDLGLTMKKLENGSFEVLKGDKLVSTIDANGEITNYLYSTGEKMMTLSDVDALTEFFFKDGTTLMKQYADGKILINYKSGKPLYEVEENNWYIYDEDGNKITSENETVTDIKKIN